MSARVLVVTYHSIGEGPKPLCIPSALFARHVAAFAAAGLTALTASEVADGLGRGEVPERSVAITFDDGFADTVETAAPILEARGFRATVFCISDFVGRDNDWPSQPPTAPRRPLASAAGLARLVEAGWEVGSHGVDHAALDTLDETAVAQQLSSSRTALETMLGVAVTAFAYPYGIVTESAGERLRAAGYEAAFTARAAYAVRSSDPLYLPRVDAHYVRAPGLLELALSPAGDAYLALRRAGGRVRRVVT